MSKANPSAQVTPTPKDLAKSKASDILTLDDLLTTQFTTIHVHSVDVRRLSDDRSPIVVGDEVMFVAVAKVRLIKTTATAAELSPFELGERADILTIADDADLVSPLQINSEKAIIDALQNRYKLAFNFMVNGVDAHYTPAPGDPPWIFRFNTSTYPTDYLKVEVDIAHTDPVPVPEPAPPVPELPAPSTDGSVTLDASISPDLMKSSAFVLALENTDPAGKPLRLKVQFRSNGGGKASP